MMEVNLQAAESIREAVSDRVKEEEERWESELDHDGNLNSDQQTLSPEEILKALNRNEDGDASLFIELHRSRFVYDHAANRWYVWREHFWEEDILNEAIHGTGAVIDAYGEEAGRQAWNRVKCEKAGQGIKAQEYAATERALLKRIRDLQTKRRKEDVLFLACPGAGLGIAGEKWDRDPWLLGCLNGVIDLRTGELRPGRPEDLIKTFAPTEWKGLYEPAPIWERTLSEIFLGKPELVTYIQRLLGYGITGKTNYHVHPIFYGPEGRNGKGTILETIKFTLGKLAHKTRSETLLDSRYGVSRGSADADTLAFRGKRIIWASETNQGGRLNPSRIKELSGGDTLNARAPYGRHPVEFEPTHLLILLTNNKPIAPGQDDALWERIHLIPFDVRFVENPVKSNEIKADPDLLEKLKTESSGILGWPVRGCLRWQKEGLNPPNAVRNATDEYRREEDLIKQFLEEKCIFKEGVEIQAGTLYKAFSIWCEDMAIRPMTGKTFGIDMKKRVDSYGKQHRTFYLGIALREGNE